jgi:FtsP/CotA-like multicopper oxidase with cupredoxin domain
MRAERAAAALALAACAPPKSASGERSFPEPSLLADLDPRPGHFEGELTAAPVTLDRTGGPVTFLAYNGELPGPQLRLQLGDAATVRFRNQLPHDEHWATGVHWHGIEGYNAADGTPLTEVSPGPGEETTYAFTATRPGVFWYHPHHRGAQALYSGLSAPLIVVDPGEAELIDRGVLPADDRVLLLSDTWTSQGRVASAEVDDPMEIMNGTEGRTLLVNGHEDPVLEVVAGSAVRLRLINASITRFWRLSVPGQELIRVGGEGGLLDRARVEGGTATGERFHPATGELLGAVEVDLGHARGELLLAPGERADVVLLTDGAPGDEWPLRWEDTPRGRHDMWMEGDEMVMGDAADDGSRPGEEVARFRLIDGDPAPVDLAEGTPLLEALGRAVGQVDDRGARALLGDDGTTLDEEMTHAPDETGAQVMTTWFGMNGADWHPDHTAGPTQPLAPSARRATLGETLVWEVRNTTAMAHPYHLHGFSYQPTHLVLWPDPEHEGDEAWPIRLPVAHDEFEDTTLLPGSSSLYFRVHLADPAGDGSAAGRWVQHCHILQHGENGMMSELVVDPG